MYRYNDSKTTYKSAEENWLQPPETILTTSETTITRKQKSEEKKNSMDILND